jgi:MSHA biogenesis protein MshO
MCNAYEDEDNNRRTVVGGNVNSIQFAPTTKPFPFTSPYQRFFLVDGPVSYVCDTTAGTLTRHDGYAISAGQSTTPGGSAAVMARYVSACSFIYQPGTSQRAGLVTLQLQLSDQGETVTLLHQVHVENAP